MSPKLSNECDTCTHEFPECKGNPVFLCDIVEIKGEYADVVISCGSHVKKEGTQ